MTPQNFYRYEIRHYGGGLDVNGFPIMSDIPNPKLILTTYDLLKETPKGYWIGFGSFGFGKLLWKKWVSKTSRKRFAYPTKEEALNNYILRTRKRVKILKKQVLSSEMGIQYAERELKKLEEELSNQ